MKAILTMVGVLLTGIVAMMIFARPTQSCSNPQIKGNINSAGVKIYHVPGGAFYNQTIIDDPERMFCTEQDAIKAGWRKSKL